MVAGNILYSCYIMIFLIVVYVPWGLKSGSRILLWMEAASLLEPHLTVLIIFSLLDNRGSILTRRINRDCFQRSWQLYSFKRCYLQIVEVDLFTWEIISQWFQNSPICTSTRGQVGRRTSEFLQDFPTGMHVIKHKFILQEGITLYWHFIIYLLFYMHIYVQIVSFSFQLP